MQVVQPVEEKLSVEVPDSQGKHLELASSELYCPGTQAEQELCSSPEYVPGLQALHSDRPAEAKYPALQL
jgi:hypothetical protein